METHAAEDDELEGTTEAIDAASDVATPKRDSARAVELITGLAVVEILVEVATIAADVDEALFLISIH